MRKSTRAVCKSAWHGFIAACILFSAYILYKLYAHEMYELVSRAILFFLISIASRVALDAIYAAFQWVRAKLSEEIELSELVTKGLD